LRPGSELGGKTFRPVAVGLAEIGCDQRQDDRTENEDGDETCAPAEGIIEDAAECRTDHGYERHAHGNVADHRGGLLHWHHVANDRTREHETGNDGGLEQAAEHQDVEVVRDKADECGQYQDDKARDHCRAASQAVGKRTYHHLHNGGHGDIGGDHHLDCCIIDAKMGRPYPAAKAGRYSSSAPKDPRSARG